MSNSVIPQIAIHANPVCDVESVAVHPLPELPHEPTVSGALRALCLRDGFAGELALATAAHWLRLSRRTLQRRLRDEGTSLQQIVDEARRHLASRMLTQEGLGIAEVAFALGFSEPGGLYRAFKRWTGMTPAAYRRAAAVVVALDAPPGE